MNKGRLIVLSAPSGCGKGTMLEQILKDESFFCSISATTRAPRENEIDGKNYYFISREEFRKLIAENGVLEYAEYCGNYYGTPLKPVNEMLENGKNVILEIEVKGAMKVKKLRPDTLMIFILPPSVAELRRRLNKRGTESAEVIEARVAEAASEIKIASQYDYVIVNDALEVAVNDFKAIIKAESMKTEFAGELIDEVIKNA